MPEGTLAAFAAHGEVGELLPRDGGDAEPTLTRIGDAGVDVDTVAAQLQKEGADSFDAAWDDLLACIESKTAALTKTG